MMSGECDRCGEHCVDCKCINGSLYRSLKKLYYTEDVPDLSENVQHPSHYQGKTLEVIDIIEDFNLGFNLGNVVKYILRASMKGKKEEDLRKAIWYLEREISKT